MRKNSLKLLSVLLSLAIIATVIVAVPVAADNEWDYQMSIDLNQSDLSISFRLQ